MRRRSITLLCAAILLLLAIFFFLTRSSHLRPEPSYQGKPLTAWIAQWGSNNWSGSTFGSYEAAQQAELAIYNMRADAIPFCLDLIHFQESVVKKKLRSMVPRRWHAPLHLHDKPWQEIGAMGLCALGTNAAPAVPALMELLSLELTRTKSDRYLGSLPGHTLGFLGGAAKPAIPLLIESLTNKHAHIQVTAAVTLGTLGLQPEIVVPALMSFITSQTNAPSGAKCTGILCLQMFGTNASSAAPLVSSFLTDPDPQVRECATNTLPYIDWAAAGRANVRIPAKR